jgi:hypothetical protein
MWLFNQPSTAARTSLIYITIGAVSVIWTGVWYIYLLNNPPEAHSAYYWCGGLLVTGLTLILIGFGVGQIGRSARHADQLPQEVTSAILNTPPTTAAPSSLVFPSKASGAQVGPDGKMVAPLV